MTISAATLSGCELRAVWRTDVSSCGQASCSCRSRGFAFCSAELVLPALDRIRLSALWPPSTTTTWSYGHAKTTFIRPHSSLPASRPVYQLGTLPGATSSEAFHINDSGTIVGRRRQAELGNVSRHCVHQWPNARLERPVRGFARRETSRLPSTAFFLSVPEPCIRSAIVPRSDSRASLYNTDRRETTVSRLELDGG